jgi:hypothetical protein
LRVDDWGTVVGRRGATAIRTAPDMAKEVGTMSIVSFPAMPEPTEPDTSPQLSRLRLVVGHEHVWQLRAVEYDDTLEVRRYECAGCDDVLFR